MPILGINAGRLGFISSISTDQIDDNVDHVLNGDYKIRSRTLLEIETENNLFGTTNFALNEVAIVKKDTSSMIRIGFLDDEFLNSYLGDGLLIFSPTGSTGYSLSCRGHSFTWYKNIIIIPIGSS